MGLSPEQVTYLRDVLGIEGVIIPAGGIPVPASDLVVPSHISPGSSVAKQALSTVRVSGQPQSARLVALAASDGSAYPREGESAELATKMTQAMKLRSSDVLWVEWTYSSGEPCPHEVLELVDAAGDRPVLVFGRETSESLLGHDPTLGGWVEWNGVKILTTHSLSDLLVNPALKKDSWVHLQMVMKVL